MLVGCNTHQVMCICVVRGCGLRSSTPIKVCVLIRQILLLRKNGPKEKFNRLWKVQNCKKSFRGTQHLKYLRFWGVIQEPAKVLLQIEKGTNKQKALEKIPWSPSSPGFNPIKNLLEQDVYREGNSLGGRLVRVTVDSEINSDRL